MCARFSVPAPAGEVHAGTVRRAVVPPRRLRSRPLGLAACLVVLGMLGVAARAEESPGDKARREGLAAQFDRGNRYALLVGINEYKTEKLSDLRFCASDALLLAEVLEKRCGYPADNVTIVADGQPPDRLPTQENIERHLSTMLRKVGFADTVLVFLSGHGAVEAGGSVLFPADHDPDNRGLSLIYIDHVRNLMHASKARQKLLVLDCCHAGGIKDGMRLGFSGEDLEGLKTAGGLITFAASRRNQQSQEAGDKRHGLFTYALAEGLGGKADADRDGIVDSDEIYRYVHAEVERMARQRGSEQTPVRILGEDVTGILALARVAGEAAQVTQVETGARMTNSIGMEFSLLLPKQFELGSPPDEAERNDDELPFPVLMGRPLFVGCTEVTQGQYEAVVGTNPSWFRPGGEGAASVEGVDASRLPVEQVTWDEAVEFCRKLSALPAEKAAGRVYRLPLEAEWEFACRAGSKTAFAFGPLLGPSDANVDGTKPYQEGEEAPGKGRTVPVASYRPNAWGLFDMHGNVAEWCADFYGGRYANTMQLTDPRGPRTGDARMTRGGAYVGRVAQARSAARAPRKPDFRHRTIGFRVICTTADLSLR